MRRRRLAGQFRRRRRLVPLPRSSFSQAGLRPTCSRLSTRPEIGRTRRTLPRRSRFCLTVRSRHTATTSRWPTPLEVRCEHRRAFRLAGDGADDQSTFRGRPLVAESRRVAGAGQRLRRRSQRQRAANPDREVALPLRQQPDHSRPRRAARDLHCRQRAHAFARVGRFQTSTKPRLRRGPAGANTATHPVARASPLFSAPSCAR